MKLGKVLLAGGLVFGACAFLSFRFVYAANPISPWITITDPKLDKINDYASASNPSYSNTHNQSCQLTEVITIAARLLPTPLTKKSAQHCMVNTKFGALSITGNYLQHPGSTTAGGVRSAGNMSLNLVPIPGSSSVINLFGGLFTGYYLQFFDNLDTKISTNYISITGETEHKLPAPTTSLKGKNGELIVVDHNSISFSVNSDWMVAELVWLGTARINVKTREVLVFGDRFNYEGGYGVNISTAISPDGKYAVVSTDTPWIFKIYDLSTCNLPTQTVKANCKYQELQPFMNKIPNYFGSFGIRFKDNYTLDMTVIAGGKYSHQVLTAAGQTTASYQYLALGDSFASGEGAYQYKAITDTSDNKCHLSQRSYPYLIGSQLGFGQYESVACSGAKIQDIVSIYTNYGDEFAQAKGKSNPSFQDEIFVGFLPGYREQIKFLDNRKPKIITLSAGGNDVGFSDKIKRCLDSDTCYTSYEDRLEIVNEVNSQFYRLRDLYTQIKNTGDPRAKIYVVGYPNIAYPEGDCAVNVHLNRAELVFAQQLVAYLNSVIKTAAANAGVVYVDVQDALDGHRFCETDSWNVAVNGLTAGNDLVSLPLLRGPIGNESYHPNQLGHDLMRAKILQQTNNLSLEMPAPNPNAKISDPANALPILQAPKSNRAINIIQNVTGTNGGVIELSKTWLTEYTGINIAFKAGSTVHGWLNSTPVDLGTFTPDASGKISVAFTLPSTVPAGFHTLHLYGKNTSDEDVDLYQTVFVAGSGPASSCFAVPISGQDADKDKIDDACDPLIAKPPVVIPLPTIKPPTIPPGSTNLSANNKPPENNPETVAGNEQLAPPPTNTVPVAENPPAPLAVTVATTRAAVAVSRTEPDITANPTVLGSSTTPPTQAPAIAQTTSLATTMPPKSTTKLLPIAAITTLSISTLALIFKKQLSKP